MQQNFSRTYLLVTDKIKQQTFWDKKMEVLFKHCSFVITNYKKT